MNRFVKFVVKGYVYNRNKNGEIIGVEKMIHRDGVVRSTKEMMGKIFRQCPDLLPCEWVDVQTVPIG